MGRLDFTNIGRRSTKTSLHSPSLRMRSPNARSPKGRDTQPSPKVVRVLQLCAPGDDYEGPEILSSPSAPEKRAFECAGLGFERKLSGLRFDHEDPAAVSPSPKK